MREKENILKDHLPEKECIPKIEVDPLVQYFVKDIRISLSNTDVSLKTFKTDGEKTVTTLWQKRGHQIVTDAYLESEAVIIGNAAVFQAAFFSAIGVLERESVE